LALKCRGDSQRHLNDDIKAENKSIEMNQSILPFTILLTVDCYRCCVIIHHLHRLTTEITTIHTLHIPVTRYCKLVFDAIHCTAMYSFVGVTFIFVSSTNQPTVLIDFDRNSEDTMVVCHYHHVYGYGWLSLLTIFIITLCYPSLASSLSQHVVGDGMVLEAQSIGRDDYRLYQWQMQSSSQLTQPW
jgi:hypothetical protein